MKITFPFGASTPPLNLLVVAASPDGATDENRPVLGLKNPTLDESAGTKSTRPSGKRTLPAYSPFVAVGGPTATFPNTGVAEVAHQDLVG